MQLRLREHQTGDKPVASIIVLHGLGASGDDFEPLVEQLDLRSAGPVRFIFPDAPTRPVTINGGYVMPAWYDIISLAAHGARQEDAKGLRETQALISGLIVRERERGVPDERVVLAGFSQGCAMSLMTGVRHPRRLAGMVGMSGYLPLASTTAAERSTASLETPIFLAHGDFDDIVPPSLGEGSRDALQALGYACEWHHYPMAHTVCAEEVADLNRWLSRVLG